jgi:hypothetical protein
MSPIFPDETKDLSDLVNGEAAFPSSEAEPVIQLLDAQKKWYEDHDDFSVYEFGGAYEDSWEKGIMVDYVYGYGKWRRPLHQAQRSSDEDSSFESANQWLAKFNEANANQLSAVYERERPRIVIGDTSISVRYSFKNKKNDYTDYTLDIQRSTGRFTESFVAPGLDPFEYSGTCMLFKF